ncbi:MAG: class I SAM-dependent methyltransferase [Leptolyngbyaceae cyanobacterium]
MTQSQDWREKVRQQFDVLPYPNRPLEDNPQSNPTYLSLHNSVIPHYLRCGKVINTHGKWILDAGCGSGYKLLALALANPGAHIVGIDISEKSVELARKRLDYHRVENLVELYCMSIEELPTLERQFDYINCDEVLYLLKDPVAGLDAMKAVLSPEGIIRVNMHSSIQRASFYRVQEFFTSLGGLAGAPSDEEIALTRETMAALQDWVLTKKQTWKAEFEAKDDFILANYLLRGDKGITLPNFFTMLQQAGLEFISMMKWRQWNLEGLFKNIEDLPITVAMGIADMSIEEQLHLFELLHPKHRLLDLYCGHPNQAQEPVAVADWDIEQWQAATVHLHPQLCTAAFRDILKAGARELGTIPLDKFLKIDEQTLSVDASIATCLYPLLDQPQSMAAMVQRWLQVRPLDPITLQPADAEAAFMTIQGFLVQLEQAGYVLVELV